MARKKKTNGETKKAKRRDPVDEAAARELELYTENDYDLVGADNSPGKNIERMLFEKIERGTFDLDASVRAWMYLMEAGARKYAREFSESRDWSVVFTKATREHAARRFAEHFYEEHKKSPERVELENRVWKKLPPDYRGRVQGRRAALRDTVGDFWRFDLLSIAELEKLAASPRDLASVLAERK